MSPEVATEPVVPEAFLQLQLAVCIHGFRNIDLFEKGTYYVRCCVHSHAKLPPPKKKKDLPFLHMPTEGHIVSTKSNDVHVQDLAAGTVPCGIETDKEHKYFATRHFSVRYVAETVPICDAAILNVPVRCSVVSGIVMCDWPVLHVELVKLQPSEPATGAAVESVPHKTVVMSSADFELNPHELLAVGDIIHFDEGAYAGIDMTLFMVPTALSARADHVTRARAASTAGDDAFTSVLTVTESDGSSVSLTDTDAYAKPAPREFENILCASDRQELTTYTLDIYRSLILLILRLNRMTDNKHSFNFLPKADLSDESKVCDDLVAQVVQQLPSGVLNAISGLWDCCVPLLMECDPRILVTLLKECTMKERQFWLESVFVERQTCAQMLGGKATDTVSPDNLVRTDRNIHLDLASSYKSLSCWPEMSYPNVRDLSNSNIDPTSTPGWRRDGLGSLASTLGYLTRPLVFHQELSRDSAASVPRRLTVSHCRPATRACAVDGLLASTAECTLSIGECAADVGFTPCLIGRLATHTPEAKHVVVCVHGLAGSSLDLTLWRNQMLVAAAKADVCAYTGDGYPGIGPQNESASQEIELLMSEANENSTFGDIAASGRALAQEISHFLHKRNVTVAKMSFLCYSLGGVIVRSALTEPELAPYLPKLQTYLSLNSPHLGTGQGDNVLVSSFLCCLRSVWTSSAAKQLAYSDAAQLEDSFLYKLAENDVLHMFNRIVLISSPEDYYVPYFSARLEAQAGHKSARVASMLWSKIEERKECHVTRLDVVHGVKKSVLGRAAHILSLDSETLVRTFFSIYWR